MLIDISFSGMFVHHQSFVDTNYQPTNEISRVDIMAIYSTQTGATECTITLGEEFGYVSIGEFRSAYEDLYGDTIKTYIIDFRHTNHMDSSGLGLLLNARKFCNSREIGIRIVNANNTVKKIFKISCFHKYFTID
ncbi:MAG: STAS domain-containing protein [Pseudomonadales bacterium]